jgi:hypothetical protein
LSPEKPRELPLFALCCAFPPLLRMDSQLDSSRRSGCMKRRRPPHGGGGEAWSLG